MVGDLGGLAQGGPDDRLLGAHLAVLALRGHSGRGLDAVDDDTRDDETEGHEVQDVELKYGEIE